MYPSHGRVVAEPEPTAERASSGANEAAEHQLLALQRTAGNAAVTAMLQRLAGTDVDPQSSPVLDVVGRGGGLPLAPEVRTPMERRLGSDFSDVRLHTDSKAAASAQAVAARAYTVGHEIVFGSGSYAPDSPAGMHTIAHELTHVQQQSSGPVSGTDTGTGISISDPSDSFERQADATATAALAAGVTSPPSDRTAIGLPLEQRSGTALQRLTVQRDPPHGADGPSATAEPPTAGAGAGPTWTAPADTTALGSDIVCTDKAEVSAVLAGLAAQLRAEGELLDEDAAAVLGSMADQATAEAAKYSAGGPLDAVDPGYLDGYVRLAHAGAITQIQAAVSRCLAAIDAAGADAADMTSIAEALAERSHLAFIASNQDELAPVLSAMDSVKSFNTHVGEYAGRVQQVRGVLGQVQAVTRLADLAQRVGDLSKAFGDQLSTAREIVDTVHNIAQLTGVTGTSNGTAMMEGINQFSAAINLVDAVVGKFGKAVPLFGDLWSRIYKPLTDACIAGLRVIAAYDERTGREYELLHLMSSVDRDANGAPVISPAGLSGGYFPGGQAVFSYVWAAKHGAAPPMTNTVRDYFLDRTDLFNIEQPSDDQLQQSDWHLLSPSTWTRSGRQNNVGPWVAANIDKVWGMLYGDLGQYIPN